MNIALVHLGAVSAVHTHPRHHLPQLRAGYAASVLRKRGHRVDLIDTAMPALSAAALKSRLETIRPDVVVLDFRIENVCEAPSLARVLRSVAPILIFAGPPSEALAAEILPAAPVQGVLGGEYEGAIGEVVEALAAGRAPQSGGWMQWNQGRLETTAPPAPIEDIDALPFPPHDEYLAAGYRIGYPVQVRGHVRMASILSTRGCPHACTFCSPVEMRSRFLPYRIRDVRSVVDELAWVQRLGANTVYFADDNFLRRPDRVVALAEEILRRNIRVKWLADCRVDDVDVSVLPLLARAGCSTLCLGAESGSQRVLDSMRKGITVDQTLAACAAIRAAGIWIVMFVILGAPGENDEDREASWRLVRAVRPELVQCHRFARYPLARGEHRVPGWRAPGSKFVGSDGTSAEHLSLGQRDLYRRYYLSPRFVADYLRTRGPFFPGPFIQDMRPAADLLSYLVMNTYA